jgi:hypothetical protein
MRYGKELVNFVSSFLDLMLGSLFYFQIVDEEPIWTTTEDGSDGDVFHVSNAPRIVLEQEGVFQNSCRTDLSDLCSSAELARQCSVTRCHPKAFFDSRKNYIFVYVLSFSHFPFLYAVAHYLITDFILWSTFKVIRVKLKNYHANIVDFYGRTTCKRGPRMILWNNFSQLYSHILIFLMMKGAYQFPHLPISGCPRGKRLYYFRHRWICVPSK